MPRLSSAAFAAFLSVLFALQVVLASFPIVLSSAGGDRIQAVICGADGLRTVTLDLSGGIVDDDRQPETQSKCPFCVIGAAAVMPAPPASPARIAGFDRIRAAVADASAPPRRAVRTERIRAPPAIV